MALSLHTHDLVRGSRWTCRECKANRRAILRWIAYAAWVVALVLGAVYLTGCGGCPTAYRHDGGALGSRAFYKVELCSDKPARVLCDSTDPLPNAECE